MGVEGLKTIFDWAAVILLFLTFAAGFGVLVTGNIISKRQEGQLRQFDKDLTTAKSELARQQERAADADAKLVGIETELNTQKAIAATAEADLIRLKESLKWRTISETQRKLFHSILHTGRGILFVENTLPSWLTEISNGGRKKQIPRAQNALGMTSGMGTAHKTRSE